MLILFHVWPQVYYGQFIVHGHVHSFDLIQAHQLFLLLQHLFEEVFVHPRNDG
jgi:hypothetical protein